MPETNQTTAKTPTAFDNKAQGRGAHPGDVGNIHSRLKACRINPGRYDKILHDFILPDEGVWPMDVSKSNSTTAEPSLPKKAKP